jgi:hypothetical protein
MPAATPSFSPPNRRRLINTRNPQLAVAEIVPRPTRRTICLLLRGALKCLDGPLPDDPDRTQSAENPAVESGLTDGGNVASHPAMAGWPKK